MTRAQAPSNVWRAHSAWFRHPARNALEMRIYYADRMHFDTPKDREVFIAPFVYMANEMRVLIDLHHGVKS